MQLDEMHYRHMQMMGDHARILQQQQAQKDMEAHRGRPDDRIPARAHDQPRRDERLVIND